MNIVMNINNIDKNNIFLDNKIKNTIIDEGVFYKLHYSNHILSLTNLLIHIDINEYNIYKNYHRYKLQFRIEKYKHIVHKISALETLILHELYTENTNKKANTSITTLLQSGYFKLPRYPENNEQIALKISGIWETDCNYGLTFKFILISK